MKFLLKKKTKNNGKLEVEQPNTFPFMLIFEWMKDVKVLDAKKFRLLQNNNYTKEGYHNLA